MFEGLEELFPTAGQEPFRTQAARIALAFVLGCIVAGTYSVTHRRAGRDNRAFLATMVLLSILIAMVTLIIGSNVARAFSLVGALAIVRFRTVVEDTRDTAFVIFAVVVGMAAGAADPKTTSAVPIVGIPVVAAAAILFRPRATTTDPGVRAGRLSVRVGLGQDPAVLLAETFAKHLESHTVSAAATARQGSALEVSYQVRLRPQTSPWALVAELNQLEGVQNVDLQLE